MDAERLAAWLDSYRVGLRDSLEVAAEQGFALAQTDTVRGELNPHEFSESARRHLRKFVNGLGLRIDALAADFPGAGLADPADAERRVEHFRDLLRLCRDLQVPRALVTLTGFDSPRTGRLAEELLGVVAEPVAPEKVREAERLLIQRTRRPATVQVRKVAGEEELAALRERLRQPAPPPPAPAPDLAAMQLLVLERVQGPIRELWPAELGELKGYEFGYTEAGAVLRLSYASPRPLDEAARGVLERAFRSRLKLPDLKFAYEWQKKSAPQQPR